MIKTRSWLRQMLVAAGAFGLLAAAAAPANAAETPDKVGLPDGTVVVLDQPFGSYTADELAGLGIAPGQHGIVEATVLAVPTGGIVPQSAHGCNGHVCITLTGSGLTVDLWETTLSADANSQSWAEYWSAGTLYAISGSFTATAGNNYYSKLDGPRSFANNTQLCNSWGGFSGHPCETVHS